MELCGIGREYVCPMWRDIGTKDEHGTVWYLKERYWWYGMKRDVAAHVAPCDVC
jgi:hypothetical protein